MIPFLFAHRAGLSAPFISGVLAGRPDLGVIRQQMIWAGVSAFVMIGIALSLTPVIALSGIEPAVAELNAFSNQGLHTGTKLLYRAFAEEVIMRWGLFSVIAFGSLKLIGGISRHGALIFPMLITSLVVTAIHAPTLNQVIETPPTMLVLIVQGIGFIASLLA